MRHPTLRRSWWIAVPLLAVAIGCDGRPARVPVSGQVLIDGEPLTTGNIQVVPADARAATGTIDGEGRFTLTTYDEGDGCVPGTHRVVVTATEMIDENQIRQLIPEKYGKFDKSGLTVTIDSPTDSLLIELSWEGAKPQTRRFEGQGDIDPTAM